MQSTKSQVLGCSEDEVAVCMVLSYIWKPWSKVRPSKSLKTRLPYRGLAATGTESR